VQRERVKPRAAPTAEDDGQHVLHGRAILSRGGDALSTAEETRKSC